MADTVVDYERVLVALKAFITTKPSHGQRDLLAAIARMEMESVRQDEQERVARLASAGDDDGHDTETRTASSERVRELAAHAEPASTH